jgi:hypothetical protein
VLSEVVQGTLYQGFVAPVVLLGALSGVTWKNSRGQGKEDGK